MLGAGTAAIAIPVASSPAPVDPDTFTQHGHTITWHGWRTSPNQMVMYGVWTASRRGEREYYYATTLGACAKAHEMDMLMLGQERGWPILSELLRANDSDEFARLQVQVKANALRILLERLRG